MVNFYTPSGQKLGVYQISTYFNGSTAALNSTLHASDQYFGSRRLATMDQLGSVGTYFPWGEARGGTNPQDTWSYATYWRDSASGLDYAMNRYYTNAYGRFMTPDPSASSQDPKTPQSWNRYPYALGDPVNGNDPTGQATCSGESSFSAYVYGGDPSEETTDAGGLGGSTDNTSGCTFDNSDLQGYYCSDATTGETTPCTNADGSDNPDAVQTGYVNGASDSSTTVTDSTSGAPQTTSSDDSSLPTFAAAGTGGLNFTAANGFGGSFNGVWTTGISYACGGSFSSRVLKSVRNGAVVGGVRGAFTGFVAGEIFGGEVTLGASGLAGAALGATIQGILGATGGVFNGFAFATGCQAVGAYNRRGAEHR